MKKKKNKKKNNSNSNVTINNSFVKVICRRGAN